MKIISFSVQSFNYILGKEGIQLTSESELSIVYYNHEAVG